jgi:hypothetical protein
VLLKSKSPTRRQITRLDQVDVVAFGADAERKFGTLCMSPKEQSQHTLYRGFKMALREDLDGSHDSDP